MSLRVGSHEKAGCDFSGDEHYSAEMARLWPLIFALLPALTAAAYRDVGAFIKRRGRRRSRFDGQFTMKGRGPAADDWRDDCETSPVLPFAPTCARWLTGPDCCRLLKTTHA